MLQSAIALCLMAAVIVNGEFGSSYGGGFSSSGFSSSGSGYGGSGLGGSSYGGGDYNGGHDDYHHVSTIFLQT